MRSYLKTIRNVLLSFVVTFFILITAASASMFGEENALLSKILLEDMQHTLHLSDIVNLASRDLQMLNEKYGYERWINKGLDQVKDYGFLRELKTDDFVLGTFQSDVGNFGATINRDDYKLGNVDKWIDQVWGKSPEIINAETKYPGSLADWKFQEENNLPGTFSGSSTMRSMVNRQNAALSYKHALWNLGFTQKTRDQYELLLDDARHSNPGEAGRITAQSNAIQNVQLDRLGDTQSSILKLMAEKELNRYQNDEIKTLSMKKGFTGLKSLFHSAPTMGR